MADPTTTTETPAFGPDPERYEKCAQPHANDRDAKREMDAFFKAVGDLRVQFRIPEVVIAAGAYVVTDEPVATGQPSKVRTVLNAASFGNPMVRPELGAVAFRAFSAPLINRAKHVQELANGSGSEDYFDG